MPPYRSIDSTPIFPRGTYKPNALVHRGFYDLLASLRTPPGLSEQPQEQRLLGGVEEEERDVECERRMGTCPELPPNGSTGSTGISPTMSTALKTASIDPPTNCAPPPSASHSLIPSLSDVLGVSLAMGFGNVNSYLWGGYGVSRGWNVVERPADKMKVDKTRISWPVDFRWVTLGHRTVSDPLA
jgi:hypothetical protein